MSAPASKSRPSAGFPQGLLLLCCARTRITLEHATRVRAILDGGLNWKLRPAEMMSGYCPSRRHVVERMLELAEVVHQDVLYDLGCGDGGIVIQAAKR